MGDTNAIVGKALHSCKTHGVHGLGERNSQGDAYVDICKANNLAITNTFLHTTRDTYIHGHLLMEKLVIKLIK